MITLFKYITKIAKLLILTALLIYIVNLFINNDQYITINLEPIPFTITAKLFIFMISFFVLGAMSTLTLSLPKAVRRAFNDYKNKSKIKSLTKTLNKKQDITDSNL